MSWEDVHVFSEELEFCMLKLHVKYQGVKNFTRWLAWPFFTSHGYCQFVWAFSPGMAILSLQGYFYHFSPCIAILTWPLSPHVSIFTSHGHFSPCVAILILRGHFNLMWSFLTLRGHSHLRYAFSPCMAIVTVSGYPPHVPLPPGRKLSCVHHNTAATSHSACTSHPPRHAKIIFFTLYGKNSPKNHEATPISSIRHLYESPNILLMQTFNYRATEGFNR